MSFALFASASPWGWLGWISPALILFFLLRVTGIPATEAQSLRSRGDEYRRYRDDERVRPLVFERHEMSSNTMNESISSLRDVASAERISFSQSLRA